MHKIWRPVAPVANSDPTVVQSRRVTFGFGFYGLDRPEVGSQCWLKWDMEGSGDPRITLFTA